MLPTDSVSQAVLQMVSSHTTVPKEHITLDSRIFSDLGIDSLGLIGLFLEIEDYFQLSEHLRDDPSLRTVGDLVQEVRSMLGLGHYAA